MGFLGSVWKGVTGVVGDVTDAFGLTGTHDAEQAAAGAANTQAQYQKEALDYLKEVEKIPQQFREGALMQLGGIAGLEGGTGDQQALIDRARQSPLYAAIMGTRDAGEDAVLRNQAATGGLRSGNTQDQLYSYNANLENTALNTAFNQQLEGLQGLAQLPSNANNIANQTSGIGQTLAQGQIAVGNANEQRKGGIMNTITGLAQGFGFSDRRLKKNLQLVGKSGQFNWYMWDWNKLANSIGLEGSSQGVLADEIVDQHRDAVSFRSGFMIVDYTKLGDRHV